MPYKNKRKESEVQELLCGPDPCFLPEVKEQRARIYCECSTPETLSMVKAIVLKKEEDDEERERARIRSLSVQVT